MKPVYSILLICVPFCFILLQCTTPVDPDTTDPDLFAYYSFDGDADDRSGHSLDLNVSGASLTKDRYGKAGKAYHFSGGSYMVADSVPFPSGKCAKTVAGWFRSADKISNQSLFGLGRAMSQKNFQISLGPGGSGQVLRVNGWGASYDWLTAVTAQECFDNTWHHCAVTYDSIKTVLYLDGEIRAETSSFTYISDSSFVRIAIGIEADLQGWNFNGDLDEIRIYSRALSSLQVKELFDL